MKKTELPFDRVYIAPFEWIIKHDPAVLSVAGSDGMLDDSLGMVLNQERRRDLLRDDVMHESLHGIIRQTSVFKNDAEWNKQEEELVSGISPRLVALLRDNPELTKWLTR